MWRSTSIKLLAFQLLITISGWASEKISYPGSMLLSPGLEMRGGAESIASLHFYLASLEDNFLGTTWVPENTVTGKMTGLAGRSLKFALLDLPVDFFSMVFMHEWYGHGARYRELGLRGIDYGYAWPPPYGDGGGWASYSSYPGEYSTQERLGIWIGGIESEHVLNRHLRQRWMVSGSMHYRESWLYFWSLQNILHYIEDALDLVEGQQRFNDPQAYIHYLNADNGFHAISGYPYSLDDLKKVSNLNALDPFFWLSIYNNLVGYLWGGQPSGNVPSLKLGNTNYLPTFHVGLTPFGVETYLENYLLLDEVLYLLYFRWGDASYYDNWGGVGALVSYPFAKSTFSADVKLDLWRQPPLKFGGDEDLRGKNTGAAFSLRSYFKIPDTRYPMKIVIEVGFKSVGFLEGYPLDKAPILMFGLQV